MIFSKSLVFAIQRARFKSFQYTTRTSFHRMMPLGSVRKGSRHVGKYAECIHAANIRYPKRDTPLSDRATQWYGSHQKISNILNNPKIRKYNKCASKHLLKSILHDTRSTTGSNLRSILLKSDKHSVSDLAPA